MQNLGYVVFVLLATLTAASQDLKSIERELQQKYQKQTLTMEQVYRDKDVLFDLNGAPTNRPLPICGKMFTVETVRLTGDELTLQGRLQDYHYVILKRMSSDPAAVRPSNKGSRQLLHIHSDGHPWNRADALAAIERIQHYPPVKFSNPPGSQPAPAGSDPRILYLLPDGPVYRAGDGVTAPHVTYQPDPEFPTAAQDAGACGHVQLKAVVQEDGTAAHVRTSDPPAGWGFDENSIAVVKMWKFEPATLNGRPVRVEISVETTFRTY